MVRSKVLLLGSVANKSQEKAGGFRSYRFALPALVLGALLLCPDVSFAVSGSMPWEGALERLAEAATGAWIKWVAIIAIAVSGVLFAIGELGGPFKTLLQIAAGLSFATGAASLAAMVLA